MENLLCAYSKETITKANNRFISQNGSFLDKGDFRYDDYFNGYISFIKKEFNVSSLSYEDINHLLSVIHYQQSFHRKTNLGMNPIEDVVMDALQITLQRYVRQLKKGRASVLDLIFDFRAAVKVLNYNKSKESNRFILGFAEIEIILFCERQKLLNEEEERKRKHTEELRVLRELKKEKEQAEKDEAKAKAAIKKNKEAITRAKTSNQIEQLEKQIAKLEEALRQAIDRKERAISMAQQTRCGYVYVISNIGSFGEGVYKIGMTRRVNPMERVHELGDASVPFPFDVHAMIYTEDAPGLESHLHKVFEKNKVNAVNQRKEYFRTTLDKIHAAVVDFGIYTQWVDEADAIQWRESEMIHKSNIADTGLIELYTNEHKPLTFDPFEEF